MTNKNKFRAWDESDKRMYKCIVGNADKEDDDYTCPLIWVEERRNWVHSDTCIIMQCTGVRDKNNIEIYEGDIIKYTSNIINYFYQTDNILRVVKFKHGTYGIDGVENGTFIAFANMPENECEVVGNVYELFIKNIQHEVPFTHKSKYK